MNFASLLRMHQNRQTTNYFGGQYAINCNRKNDVGIVIGAGQNYHHTNKKRGIGIQPLEPINQSLSEIFANFQENSHVQWILQLQSHKVKIHTFKPSKFKNKKQEPEHKGKFQPRLYPQQRQNINPITPVTVINEDNLSDFIQQDHHQNRERKNYSPMRQMRQKKQELNWRENFNQNQNKFSFGDEADKPQPLQQQMLEIRNQDVENTPDKQDQSQLTLQNKSYIEQKNEYEIQEEGDCTARVNLMEKFEDLQSNEKKPQNIIQKQQIPQTNQITKIQSVKNLQQQLSPSNPAPLPSTNPHVGFSFEEMGKADKNQETLQLDQLTIGQQPQQTEEEQHQSGPPSDRTQHSVTEGHQQPEPVKPMEIIKQETEKENYLTLIKTDVQIKDVERKTLEIKQTSPKEREKERQLSPKRIYCKANVRTLTPQKINYPSVQAKILQNNDIRPFSIGNDANKTNLVVNTKKTYDSKVVNVESERGVLISNSERLLALIDESKRLLKSRTLGEEKKNEDRISRIVLHQPPSETKITLREAPVPSKESELVKLQLKKNEKKPEQKQPEQNILNIANPPKALTPPQEEAKNLPSQKLTPSKRDQPNPISPLQQKTKFFNPLANVETNYANENSNLSPYLKNIQSAVAQNQIPQFVPTSVNAQSNIVKTAEGGQKTYQNANYTYKPLSMPPLPKQAQQKDGSIYKAPVYQPYISSQPITQVYQPPVQPYQQVNDPSTIQKAPIQPQMNVNFNVSQVKSYSPYFTVGNTSTVKPSVVPPVQQNKPNQTYQTFTYNGFHSSQQNSTLRPLTPTQPSNYYKLNNASYVSPFEKVEKTEYKETYQTRINQDLAQKENVKPSGLGISGIRCVESKIYDPIIQNLQSDPKQSSIEFSIRTDNHFHPGAK